MSSIYALAERLPDDDITGEVVPFGEYW